MSHINYIACTYSFIAETTYKDRAFYKGLVVWSSHDAYWSYCPSVLCFFLMYASTTVLILYQRAHLYYAPKANCLTWLHSQIVSRTFYGNIYRYFHFCHRKKNPLSVTIPSPSPHSPLTREICTQSSRRSTCRKHANLGCFRHKKSMHAASKVHLQPCSLSNPGPVFSFLSFLISSPFYIP